METDLVNEVVCWNWILFKSICLIILKVKIDWLGFVSWEQWCLIYQKVKWIDGLLQLNCGFGGVNASDSTWMRPDIDLTTAVATIHPLDLFQSKMEQEPEQVAPPPPLPPPLPPPHKVCLVKRNNLPPPFSEAAKALLSSPLPPQLVVDFKRKFFAILINRLTTWKPFTFE